MFTIELATPSDSPQIGTMIYQMECELWGDDVEQLCLQTFIETSTELMKDDRYWVFKAVDANRDMVGLLTVGQNAAIFAGGYFGEIMEVYISQDLRSKGVGAALVEHAKAFSIAKGWKYLAVGAPSQPAWKKTLQFYLKCGFTEVGPKLEMPL
ncbi:N-acetyltransferase family protein [Photobacterium satsumensis]|uniref:GNAT family N-acetyltransferase n=1 Tax=Photobacterium satsumensis TaxID=2910239 RepID=UPI003D0FA489